MDKEGDNDFAIHVAVVGKAIIVTMPGTGYSITYRKPGKTPWLVASNIRDDFNSPINQFTFRARAFTAANDKAAGVGV